MSRKYGNNSLRKHSSSDMSGKRESNSLKALFMTICTVKAMEKAIEKTLWPGICQGGEKGILRKALQLRNVKEVKKEFLEKLSS